MDSFGPSTFGELNAADYDATQDPGTTDLTVDLLFEIFGPTRVFEFAIGTGRVALPLAARGCTLAGNEGSPLMVEKLRAKPGGADIPVAIGDMIQAQVDGPFDHAFLIFNTLFNLPSQAAQVECFAHAARMIKPGGTFVIETFVPDMSDFSRDQRVATKRLDMDSVWIEAATHDRVAQVLEMQRIRITKNGMKLVPLRMRYAYPQEIDLMAKCAGFQLRSRWGGWRKESFTADSGFHISVYEKQG